jgi:hypothetical protein
LARVLLPEPCTTPGWRRSGSCSPGTDSSGAATRWMSTGRSPTWFRAARWF